MKTNHSDIWDIFFIAVAYLGGMGVGMAIVIFALGLAAYGVNWLFSK